MDIELVKLLFKGVYGAMIDAKFTNVSSEQIVKVALETVMQFAKREGVTTYSISNKA